MRIPGFDAEAGLYQTTTTYQSRAAAMRPAGQVVAAYWCPDPTIFAYCDCFDTWDCWVCTYQQWPRPCRNPFG